jgi:hypothetical protein
MESSETLKRRNCQLHKPILHEPAYTSLSLGLTSTDFTNIQKLQSDPSNSIYAKPTLPRQWSSIAILERIGRQPHLLVWNFSFLIVTGTY